jgi:hypothetical protein
MVREAPVTGEKNRTDPSYTKQNIESFYNKLNH